MSAETIGNDQSASKTLGHDDESGFNFAKEMLGENHTAAVNFDRLQKHPIKGYIIFEYLLCEERQAVSPYTSHPNRYWNKNMNKFLSLWRAKLDLNATLYLVNYAKKGTKSEDEVLLIEVQDINENGIIKEKKTKYTRESFKEWFSKINNECLENTDSIIADIYTYKSLEEHKEYVIDYGKYSGKTLGVVSDEDPEYLEWVVKEKARHWKIIAAYLERIINRE